MAKLKNQIIKEKVLVLNSDHLRHVREGVWRRVFPNEGGGGGDKKKQRRADASQMVTEMGSSGFSVAPSSPPNRAVALNRCLVHVRLHNQGVFPNLSLWNADDIWN